MISREKHVRDDPDSNVQVKVDYHSGLGEIIASKFQAEGGLAKQVSVDEDGNVTVSIVDTINIPRWIGNGRTVKNNRGNIVKQYEPYFSTNFNYESEAALVESGCFVINHFDALDRVIQTDYPNDTFGHVVFEAYKTTFKDQNDNLKSIGKWYR